jgi:hypothetical protein
LLLVVFARESSFVDFLDGPAGLAGLAILLAPAAWIYHRLKPAELPEQLEASVGLKPPTAGEVPLHAIA